MSKDKASQRIVTESNGQSKSKSKFLILIIVAFVAMALVVGVCMLLFVGNKVNMNYDWTFDNAKATSTNAYVGNSVNNSNTVYFTIALEGSEDVIYKSPYIPVGSHMENITLNSNLEAGTYEAVLTYHVVDDAYKDMASVSVAVTITIEH